MRAARRHGIQMSCFICINIQQRSSGSIIGSLCTQVVAEKWEKKSLPLTEAATPLVMIALRLCLDTVLKRANNLRPTQMGMPIIMAGTAIPASRAIPTGAPTNVPNCHRIFFLRDHGFLPQNVQPDGLEHNFLEH